MTKQGERKTVIYEAGRKKTRGPTACRRANGEQAGKAKG